MSVAVGTSLIIAGATLVWKLIQMVNDTRLTLVMLFSASAVPLIDVLGWWRPPATPSRSPMRPAASRRR